MIGSTLFHSTNFQNSGQNKFELPSSRSISDPSSEYVDSSTLELPEDMPEGAGELFIKSEMFNDPTKQQKTGMTLLTIKKQ